MAELSIEDQSLIHAIKTRVQNPKRATQMAEAIIDYPVTIYPPASLEQIEQAERTLGIRLPGLI